MVKLFLKNSNLCDHNSQTLQTDRQTDGRTDRQTTCDRNTAPCTKLHRAVKTKRSASEMYPTICIELADDYVNRSTFEEDMRENFTFRSQ